MKLIFNIMEQIKNGKKWILLIYNENMIYSEIN